MSKCKNTENVDDENLDRVAGRDFRAKGNGGNGGDGALRGLYAVTPADNLLPRLSALVSLALDGGVRLVQYRNKDAPMPQKRSQAAELLRICHARDARLVVNDDVWLAIEIGADGVHLGRDDADPAMARQALGPKRLLGVSCYDDIERAVAAEAAGADYVAIGSIFPSPTKPEAARASLDLIAQTRSRVRIPVVAIGGIKLDNAAGVLAAGADMLAVVSDLFDAMDIKGRAAAFQKLFDQS